MNKITNYTRKHPLGFTLSLIGLFVTLLFAYSLFAYIAYNGKAKVVISLVPNDAQLYINSNKVSSGTHYLTPGEYSITASKEGYGQYKKTFTITDEERSIPISLMPQSDQAKSEAEKNDDSYLKNEGIAGKQADTDGKRFREKNQIVSELPYKTLLYTIGYQSDISDPSGMSIIVTVEASEGMRADVVAQIARWGYDPTELNIQFRNYRNPFQ